MYAPWLAIDRGNDKSTGLEVTLSSLSSLAPCSLHRNHIVFLVDEKNFCPADLRSSTQLQYISLLSGWWKNVQSEKFPKWNWESSILPLTCLSHYWLTSPIGHIIHLLALNDLELHWNSEAVTRLHCVYIQSSRSAPVSLVCQLWQVLVIFLCFSAGTAGRCASQIVTDNLSTTILTSSHIRDHIWDSRWKLPLAPLWRWLHCLVRASDLWFV